MAKILFLDDEPMRHELVDLCHGEKHDISHMWNAEECIEALSTSKWDVVSLDNDLGDGMTEGRFVARWMEEHPQYQPAQIIIHTSNIVAEDDMKAALPHAQVSDDWWRKPS